MDAKRMPRWAWAGVLSAIGGCTLGHQYPTAHQEEPKPPESQEPAQIVGAPAPTDTPSPQDEVSQTVLGWVARLDDLRQRPAGTDAWQAHDTRYASDTQPGPTTTPADLPPIDVFTKPVTDTPTSAPSDPAPAIPAQPGTIDPPELGNVAVRPATEVRPITMTTLLGPGINAPTRARTAPTSLSQFLAQLPAADDSSFREQLDMRVLWVIAGDYERARHQLEMVTAEQQELATRFVEAWIVIREWHMGDQAGAASAAVRELEELQRSLFRLSDLSIPVLEICSEVRGYGQYDTIEPPQLLAGLSTEFVLYCEVSDFVSEQRDGDYNTTFDITTTILNRAGDVVLEIKDADIVDRCRNHRHDCFIPRLVCLPATLSPGRYVAKVTVVDKLGKKVAENRAPFQVVVHQ